MPPTHAYLVRVFDVFFRCSSRTSLGTPRLFRCPAPRRLQHVRFRTPNWSPKAFRKHVCWLSKRLLKLVFCKNSRKNFRNHASQCFVVLGRPNMASETDPKSLENRKPFSRAFYVEVLLRDLLKPLPEHSRGPLGKNS